MTPDIQEKKGSKVNPKEMAVPSELPILPVHGFVFFPGMGFPLQVSHPVSRSLVDDVLLQDRLVAVVSQRKEKEAEFEGRDAGQVAPETLYRVGVVGYIHKMIKTQEGTYQVLMSAIKRIRIVDYTQEEPYLRANIELFDLQEEMDQEVEALVLNLRTQFKKVVELSHLPAEINMTISSLTSPFHLAYMIGSHLGLSLDEEQSLLEVEEIKPLLRQVTVALNKRVETLELSNEMQRKLKEDMDQKQREFFLRQQMKAIQKELGEGDEQSTEIEELRTRVAAAGLSSEAQKAADRELGRLGRIPPSSPEYSVARTYLEWLLDLPWSATTPDSLDIEQAQKQLDKDHYGLEKVKKRIIEFLAVRKLKQDMKGPILCFVGPPGVGKTSLGQSIARTMGRKFVRISLGGVRDEAEIRGHRRTYIGALPGRIIQSLKKAGSNNPLFMLDEVDKIGADFRGDPSSALLEVLDPEQNHTFSDHYLEIPFDLSRVMFISTANVLDTIPPPLRDRMEILELPGYTEEEKLMIAKEHLLPNQLEAHGLTGDDLVIEDAAITQVIRSYTRESGVRNLERQLAGICRGVAKKIASGHTGCTTVGPADISPFLGPASFFPETTARTWSPGLATGLAWTPVGGELIFIESAKMPGRGALTLTGKLGEVMKESATAALTYIRSHAKMLDLEDKLFAEWDIHVHIPEGAIPKDGPSAGVAMVVSLVSLLTGRTARRDVAMTGEITLRGDVLPVGGVKEKVLAASRAGLTDVLLPSLNEKDIIELPDRVRQGMRFHFIQGIDEALRLAFEQ